ncbi:MAG: choice-of-anchor L domain-containing protein [Prevotella sp.]|jgi:hypothetical protein|nr:choice-of-anchor L domain-containing protein [Prevotella sp.]
MYSKIVQPFYKFCFVLIGVFFLQAAAINAQDSIPARQVNNGKLKSINTNLPKGSIAVNRDATYQNMKVKELVESVFVKTGACASVSNITAQVMGWPTKNTTDWTNSITQGGRGLAYFNKNGTTFPLEEGLLLATGNTRDAEGPNSNPPATQDQNSDVAMSNPESYTVGEKDTELTALLSRMGNSGGIKDAAILEFDFTPASTSMRFQYIFASEEYPEYVHTTYNDIFGFFVTDKTDNSLLNKNIALLPDGSAVSINTVNSGYYANNLYSGTGTNPNNSALFVANKNGSAITEFDGYTKELTASITGLNPCHTYHLKLAVGNVSDHTAGSGVFLKANSFEVGNKMSLFGCDKADATGVRKKTENNYIHFSRSDLDTSSALTINLSYSTGAVVNGTHYTQLDGSPLPASVTIPAGAPSYDLKFKATDAAVAGTHFDVSMLCPSCISGAPGGVLTVNILDGIAINAGDVITQCDPVYTMGEGIAPLVSAGKWTVVGDAAGVTIANNALFGTTVTVLWNQRSDDVKLRWTVKDGDCVYSDDVVLRYEPCDNPLLPVNPGVFFLK